MPFALEAVPTPTMPSSTTRSPTEARTVQGRRLPEPLVPGPVRSTVIAPSASSTASVTQPYVRTPATSAAAYPAPLAPSSAWIGLAMPTVGGSAVALTERVTRSGAELAMGDMLP